MFFWNASSPLPNADALVNSAEGLKDEEAGIFNEVLQASNQEEVIHKHLKTESISHKSSANTGQTVMSLYHKV